MRSPFDFASLHHRFATVLGSLSVAIGFAVAQASGEQQPGELLTVAVAAQQGPVSIAFRFCPPGQLLHGRPALLPPPTGNALTDKLKRGSRLAEIKGVYVMEMEVSQQQFERLLGKQALKSVFQRMLAGDAGGRGDNYPVRGVTVHEAAKFCIELGKLDAKNRQAVSGLEDRRFRLPTHFEWQYACRAINDPDRTEDTPHFNVWPNLEDVKQDIVRDCQDTWKNKLAETAPFTGTQDQVIKIIEAHDDPVRAIAILSAFLQKGLGTNRSYRDNDQPMVVESGHPNGWLIRNMHGNVCEWTISVKPSGNLDEVWKLLAMGDQAAQAQRTDKLFFPAGGCYNDSLSNQPKNWIRFSVWGGPGMKEQIADPYSLEEIDQENIVSDRLPGFRVLLERVLVNDWLFFIRQTTVLGKQPVKQPTREQLQQYRKIVAELATSSEKVVAQTRINFYDALAEYRAGNRTAGTDKLLESTRSLGDEDDGYFRHLQRLVNQTDGD